MPPMLPGTAATVSRKMIRESAWSVPVALAFHPDILSKLNRIARMVYSASLSSTERGGL